jgi:DNA-binding CsgD family transcriptional regulator/tetratricopeptide (TPR) repeat protein
MAAELLERDEFLLALNQALHQATEGRGRIALVSGEAGIGKTSLAECFVERRPPGVRLLWGACEALFTPRPLGPLYDLAQQAQTPLRAVLDSTTNRATLFAAVLAELTPTPTIVVVEDVHWADEATLDLLKYLARRVHQLPTLLILTYRDDELSRDHPLRLVLGDLPARDVTRLRLPPLSEAAVAAIARRAHRPGTDLYRATGGNPFFLIEALASDTPGVPESIADAVLAQVARRSSDAQRLLELMSIVPNRIEWWLAEAVGVVESVALEECLGAGILHFDGKAVGFRHELARQAVERALSPARRRALHTRVVRRLLEHGVEQATLARLAHHAAQAEDSALTLRFAPAAAKQASDRGAHREAMEQYRTALRFADSLELDKRADLLEALAHECLLTGQWPDAINAGEDALAIWRALDIPQRIGHNLRWLSRVYWYAGQRAETDRYMDMAVRLLETLPPDNELAWAYSYRGMFAMLAEDAADAQVWAGRALELAEQLCDDEIVIHALNTRGIARLQTGDQGGQDEVGQSLRMALERGLEEHAGRAYSNLSSYFVRFRDHASAYDCTAEGIAYCADRDLDLYTYQMMSWRALAALEEGKWESASEDAMTVVGAHRVPPINRIQALVTLGCIRVRRGDPDADALLDEARDLALTTGELQRIAPVMAARAEAAWLRADLDRCAAEARVGFDLACGHINPWALGQLSFWLWRAGALTQPLAGAATPYKLQMAGDWRSAADAWERIGSPYEQALALLDGDEPALRMALATFERLGARPAAEIARQRLRARGARGVGLPRGPRPTTRANPGGLTPRQLEILLLLAEGLHNNEIADRLTTTPKTVDHHVSAVLAKLHARSRAEAVRVAYELGLLPLTATVPSSNTTSNIGM